MKKVVFYAFQGEPMCFLHILFNAIDMQEKGMDVRIVIEGKATALVQTMVESKNPLFQKVRELGLIDAVCRACAQQMDALAYIQSETDLPINGDLMGHPPMTPYLEEGYELITL